MTTTPFDGMRALREEIAGLNDVRSAMLIRERAAQRQMAESEIEYQALAKLRGFVDAELARKREALASLTA